MVCNLVVDSLSFQGAARQMLAVIELNGNKHLRLIDWEKTSRFTWKDRTLRSESEYSMDLSLGWGGCNKL